MKTWNNLLITLILIAVPALLIFLFFSPEWNTTKQSKTFITLISFALIAWSIVITFVIAYLKVGTIDALNFNVPLSIVLVIILVSSEYSSTFRLFFVVIGILTAFPVNIFTSYLKQYPMFK